MSGGNEEAEELWGGGMGVAVVRWCWVVTALCVCDRLRIWCWGTSRALAFGGLSIMGL